MRRRCSSARSRRGLRRWDAERGTTAAARKCARAEQRPARAATCAKGFAQADVVVEGEYRTQVQTHCCLETHAVVADWRADGLTVYMSTQFTAGVRSELAHAFGLPLSRVRVVVDAMGGGFGSKSGAGNYVRAAVALSRQAGAPVRLVLDRKEEHLDSGNRPGTVQHIRIGAQARRHAHRDLARHTTARLASPSAPASGNIAQAMYACAEFRDRAVRRVHQCRPRLPDARAGQRAGRVRARAGDRRARREARHRSARAARPDRSEPGAARGAAPRRRAHRLEPPACARRRFTGRSSAASAWRSR